MSVRFATELCTNLQKARVTQPGLVIGIAHNFRSPGNTGSVPPAVPGRIPFSPPDSPDRGNARQYGLPISYKLLFHLKSVSCYISDTDYVLIP